MKYRCYFLIALLALTIKVAGQDEQYPSFLNADSSWGSEIIVFPIDWAPGMTIKGYEELRFVPDWSNPASAGFWSLIMGWNVAATQPLDAKEIQENLYHYFDGLMKPNHWATEFPAPVVELDLIHHNGERFTYEGVINVFDGFHTGKQLQLNLRAIQKYDATIGRTYIMIRFSASPFTAPIWAELEKITLKNLKTSDKG